MKPFQIEVQGKPYTIKLKSSSRVDINGTVYKLRSLPHRNVIFVPMEYDLPIEGAKVMLVPGMFTTQLVVDGVYVKTGKPYTPIAKVPVWAYVLAALDLTMFLGGGAIPVFLAVIAFYLTLRVATLSYSTAFRVSISVGILLAGWALILLLALAITLL